MSQEQRVLSKAATRAFYDRMGRKQDSQGFYEDPAVDTLIAHADFASARHVFEFGCGTGKLAARLLDRHLGPSAHYLGCDVSTTMVDLAKARIAGHRERARVQLSDGAIRFPCDDQSVDRVVATYVLDLLSEVDIRRFLAEAARALVPGGRLCLVSLTRGVTVPSRIVSSLWMIVFRVKPAIVGGCRPLCLASFVDSRAWRIDHRAVVTPFGVPSEVLILSPGSAS